jgi:predicted ATPase
MRLSNITLQNFKCFGQRQSIDVKRLTILTGANSSGKSSLMYSVLGAIQSGEFPLQFSTNGKYVNMGNFQDISFRKKKGDITLAFTFEDALSSNMQNVEISTIWSENPKNKLPRLREIALRSDSFLISLRKAATKYILDLSFNSDKRSADAKKISEAVWSKFLPALLEEFETPKDRSKKNSKQKIAKQMSDLYSKSWEIKDLEIPNLDVLLGKKLPSFEAESAWLGFTTIEIVKFINAFDKTMNFISSFRLHPDRTYLETTKNELKVERFGENYLDQIIAWETKKSPKFGELMNIMQELELLSGIKANRMEGGRFEITVQSKKDGVFTSLADVGFGISQFLPILVADLQLPNDSTLFIAQPEIHLHPDIQSRFGEFLIKQIHNTKKNYLIETHSEYCLNRLRLGIVKGEIDASDIAIYYLNASESNPYDTDVHTIEFTKSGQILGAPPDFFTTYQMDVMEIALHAE